MTSVAPAVLPLAGRTGGKTAGAYHRQTGPQGAGRGSRPTVAQHSWGILKKLIQVVRPASVTAGASKCRAGSKAGV